MNTKELPRLERKRIKRAQRRWVRVSARLDGNAPGKSKQGRRWLREFQRFEWARWRAVRMSGALR